MLQCYRAVTDRMLAKEPRRLSSQKQRPGSGPQSTKNHRFESFSHRVAKIKIDPVRRLRQLDSQEEAQATATFFRGSLERWKDLNLTQDFRRLVREVEPYCNSLPQILHHRAHILHSIISYSKAASTASLEPLLDLLSSIAHDLGVTFEEFYPDTLELIVFLVTRHADVEVLEWSFNCLAWLFKYLSRLLVPDLRPTLRLIGSLLGKNTCKQHVARFAAEAMSFLVRKAALKWSKDTQPLKKVLEYIKEDVTAYGQKLEDKIHVSLYQQGLMGLLFASMKGIERKLHSSASDLYHCLLELVVWEARKSESPISELNELLFGVTVALIHHTDATNFQPILSIIQREIAAVEDGTSSFCVAMLARLLFLVSAVRHGSRIENWELMVEGSMRLLQVAAEKGEGLCINEVLRALAIVFQQSPQEYVHSRIRSFSDLITREDFVPYFLSFCYYFHDIGPARFEQFVMPCFSKFLVSNWQHNRLQLYATIPKVLSDASEKRIYLPEQWQSSIVHQFRSLHNNKELASECFGFLEIDNFVSISTETSNEIFHALDELLHTENQEFTPISTAQIFSLGSGLKFHIKMSIRQGKRLDALWARTCLLAPQFGASMQFLDAMFMVAENESGNGLPDNIGNLINVLVRNLKSESPTIRQTSLRILQIICRCQYPEHLEIITTALTIELSLLELSSSRSISVQVRKLAALYDKSSKDEWPTKIIPHFCFGVTTYKMRDARLGAITALRSISEYKAGEDIIIENCLTWLTSHSPVPQTTQNIAVDSMHQPLNNFQCSNMRRTEDRIHEIESELASPRNSLLRHFENSHAIQYHTESDLPLSALQILEEIPNVAEKRSRSFVTYILSALISTNADFGHLMLEGSTETGPNENVDNHAYVSAQRYRKAFLSLLGKFKNPSVLYRSSEIQNALMELLASGDLDTQRGALKALLAWNDKDLRQVEESLFKLLDEACLHDEVGHLVSTVNGDIPVNASQQQFLISVILRLLYGRMTSRAGTSGNKSRLLGRRRAILQALSQLGPIWLADFIQLAQGPVANITVNDKAEIRDLVSRTELLPPRKQLGLVRLTKSLLEYFGSTITPQTRRLSGGVAYCILYAHGKLTTASKSASSDETASQHESLLKCIRLEALQCFTLLISHGSFQDLKVSLEIVSEDILLPRLETLPIETAQSISWTLRLISSFVSSSDTILFLVKQCPHIFESVSNCLGITFAKADVKLFVLNDIFNPIAKLCDNVASEISQEMAEVIADKVVKPSMSALFHNIGAILQNDPSKEILASSIDLMARLMPMVEDLPAMQDIVKSSIGLLRQPSARVNPKMKGDILRVIAKLLPLVRADLSVHYLHELESSLSSLFGYFRDRQSRVMLCKTFHSVFSDDVEMGPIAELCMELNSYSVHKLDEPDFEKRSNSFDFINESGFKGFSTRQWIPLVYNMLYFIKDEDELSTRTKASFALRRVVEVNIVPAGPAGEIRDSIKLIKNIVLPAIRSGMSEISEFIRGEFLSVMADLVRHNRTWDEIHDMSNLLMDGDEEASFFNNILHIQQHRRMRTLRRLRTIAAESPFRSYNVAHFFIPLLEHFVFDKNEDESAHNLSAEAIATIGGLATCLEWPQFRATFRRYTSYIHTKPDLTKSVIRLISMMSDALKVASGFSVSPEESSPPRTNSTDPTDTYTIHSALKTTMPSQDKLADDACNNILPQMLDYLREKDEALVSLRVPISVSIVKILTLLPKSRFESLIPAVLTNICNILRSKAQESRDLTRNTLAEIATLIGPAYFGFIIMELRNALSRGYQLHVLSFTLHSLLVSTSSIFKSGDLSYCLAQIVAVITEDIFGSIGQEKDSEEYVSRMREVKSNKSYDSMELVASVAQIRDLPVLVGPLQNLLKEKIDARLLQKIDELLRRLGLGLKANGEIHDQRILVFCHELISNTYQDESPHEARNTRGSVHQKRFLVHHGSSRDTRSYNSSYTFKLRRFGLDLLRLVLTQNRHLLTPLNVSGFIPVIGDALLDNNEEIQISAMRLLMAISKVSLPSIDDNITIYITECVKIIKNSMSTSSDHAQAALKLVSTLLKERPRGEIREADIAYLLKRLAFDIEEPNKQGISFTFLKAIMGRKIVVGELYEVMDLVAKMMVTNHTKNARDSARRVYCQFLLDYPQSQERFSKQLAFLVKNLEYKHHEGRESVLETIHLLYKMVGDSAIEKFYDTFFVPLAMIIVNDDSSQCREMAGALIRGTFENTNAQQLAPFLRLMRNWLQQFEQPTINRLSLQMYSIFIDAKGQEAQSELAFLMPQLERVMEIRLDGKHNADWELLFYAMQILHKIVGLSQTSAFAMSTAPLWSSVRKYLDFPHSWVRASAAKLLGEYFSDFARSKGAQRPYQFPLCGSHGLVLTEEEVREVTSNSLLLLRSSDTTEELASQTVRNLIFLSKVIADTSLTWSEKPRHSPAANESAMSDVESELDDLAIDNGESLQTNNSPRTQSALAYLINATSTTLRQPPQGTRSADLNPLHSSLTLLASLSSSMPLPTIHSSFRTIILPLLNLTDSSIPVPFSSDPAFVTGYKKLQANATELMTLLQSRLGVTKYMGAMQEVKQVVKEKREERRGKRKIQAVAAPEKVGERKRKKREREKESRKKRASDFGRRRKGL